MVRTPIYAVDEAVNSQPVEAVWKVVADIGSSPRWWPRSLHLRVLSVSPELVGSEVELRPMGGRPFRCQVEAVEPNRSMRMRYEGSFVTGRGEWLLEPVDAGTRVRYTLDVEAEGRLVSWLSRLVSLEKIHSREMRKVLRQLELAVQPG